VSREVQGWPDFVPAVPTMSTGAQAGHGNPGLAARENASPTAKPRKTRTARAPF